MKNHLKSLVNFGELKLNQIFTYLFIVGSAIIAFKSFFIGKAVYLTNFYIKGISYLENGQRWYTDREVNNLPLGIVSGVIYFIIALLLWKLVCELLYIIFKRIERE